MVILSASVCNNDGKVLVARQFVHMTRLRIEGLLSAFPKLLGSEQGEKSKQHTFVETDEVRYLYQPMDTMYVLLVTNKSSNILSDLATLRLLAKLVPEYCSGHDEESITERAFELVFAFDEAVSLGYSECVDMQQIRTYTSMESHEEKLHQIIQDSKFSEAKMYAQQQAERLDKIKKENNTNFPNFPMTGMGSGSSSNNVSSNTYGQSNSGFGSGDTNNDFNNAFGDDSGGFGHNDHDSRREEDIKPKKSNKPRKTKGLALGSSKNKNKSKNLFDDMIKSEREKFGANVLVTKSQDTSDDANYSSPEPVKFSIQEKCTIDCERDGAMKKFQVEGALTVTITDPDYSHITIHVDTPEVDDLQYRPHPKMNKSSWKQQELSHKDDSGFGIGSSNKQQILKWKLRTKDDDMLPITFNFWPSESNGNSVMTCDYAAEGIPDGMVFDNVVVTIPGIHENPEISDGCDGETSYDRSNEELQWQLGAIENGSSGELEFSLPELDSDDEFFPINVHFQSQNLYSNLSISGVSNADGEPVEFIIKKSECYSAKFQIS